MPKFPQPVQPRGKNLNMQNWSHIERNGFGGLHEPGETLIKPLF
jgi:hypothetical protein